MIVMPNEFPCLSSRGAANTFVDENDLIILYHSSPTGGNIWGSVICGSRAIDSLSGRIWNRRTGKRATAQVLRGGKRS